MSIGTRQLRWALLAAFAAGLAAPATAADIGQIKVTKGEVSIERNGQVMPGDAGVRTFIASGDCFAIRPEITASDPLRSEASNWPRLVVARHCRAPHHNSISIPS